MKVTYLCDACNKEGEGRHNRYNVVPPLNWFAARNHLKSDDHYYVCSGTCLDKLAAEVKQWYAVDDTFKMVPIGKENCKWCPKFGNRGCPSHRSKKGPARVS